MNEELKRELEEVRPAAQSMAKRYQLQKLVLLFAALTAVVICFKIMAPLPCIMTEVLILLIVRQFSIKAQRKMQEALYTNCDPYLQYAYLEAYEKTLFGKTKKVKASMMVSKAQCMVLAGEPQAAISILHDIKDAQRLPAPTRAVYYNLLLRSYAQYGWEQKRMDLVSQVEKESQSLPNKQGVYMDVILRLEELARKQEEGDVAFLEEYYDANEGTYMFQKVSAHYALADVMLRAGQIERAMQHMEFVKDNGNKLYYIKELQQQLKKAQKQKAEEQEASAAEKAAPLVSEEMKEGEADEL